MKSFRVILLYTLTCIFAGCPARSINPLFTEKDVLFDPSLIGTWLNDDEIYTFEKLQEKNYKLVIRPREENDSAVYVVCMGKIGAWWFLDSYPIVHSGEHHYLSVHVFTRIELLDDTLKLASLEADWLGKMINRKEIEVEHIKREGEIILTASTQELQRLLAAIGNNNEAFPNANTFIRRH